MGIHRARLALAVIALAGLAGCRILTESGPTEEIESRIGSFWCGPDVLIKLMASFPPIRLTTISHFFRSFDDAIKAAYDDMYQDTKMIREFRKMKRQQQGSAAPL